MLISKICMLQLSHSTVQHTIGLIISKVHMTFEVTAACEHCNYIATCSLTKAL